MEVDLDVTRLPAKHVKEIIEQYAPGDVTYDVLQVLSRIEDIDQSGKVITIIEGDTTFADEDDESITEKTQVVVRCSAPTQGDARALVKEVLDARSKYNYNRSPVVGQQTIYVAASEDDGDWIIPTQTWDDTSNVYWVGSDYDGYVRFTISSVGYEVGDELVSATYSYVPATFSGTFTVDVRGLEVTDPDLTQSSTRDATTTTSNATLDSGDWSADVRETVDVTSIIQEIIDDSGKSLVDVDAFALKLVLGTGSGSVSIRAYDGASQWWSYLALTASNSLSRVNVLNVRYFPPDAYEVTLECVYHEDLVVS